ncbi:MAG: hypothetical protein IH991_25590, partial [Planctomycetes bacterium]|nr:hypothetical protein [Planctomycetota bacterium]
RLKGADNLIEIHSRWYSSSPLVIQGRGDGVNATAAGVLSDIIELGFSKSTKDPQLFQTALRIDD